MVQIRTVQRNGIRLGRTLHCPFCFEGCNRQEYSDDAVFGYVQYNCPNQECRRFFLVPIDLVGERQLNSALRVLED